MHADDPYVEYWCYRFVYSIGKWYDVMGLLQYKLAVLESVFQIALLSYEISQDMAMMRVLVYEVHAGPPESKINVPF